MNLLMRKKGHFSKGIILRGILMTFLAVYPWVQAADARVGLVTVPKRDKVQVTIYNTADITLVRETRSLTMAKGANKLEFSWAGTLIDPTSVQFEAKTHGDELEVIDISYPPNAPQALVWNIESEVEGTVEVEISYFTAGLTWAADYEAVVEANGNEMNLKSYIKVTNNSGEEYEGAQVRLIVGNVNLVEKISDLAKRGNRPMAPAAQMRARKSMGKAMLYDEMKAEADGDAIYSVMEMSAPEVVREGLSEYFIYTVSGRHEVPNRWSVRWLNFSQDDVPVYNFYKFEVGRYDPARRFLKLYNRKDDKLGAEPLPNGMIHVYERRVDATRKYIGGSRSKYIPVGEKWEINLGLDPDVVIKPKKKDHDVYNVEYDDHQNPSGWDLAEVWDLDLLNSRANEVTIQIDRNFSGSHTVKGIEKSEKWDLDTARFTRKLQPRSRETISYKVIYHRGTRAKR